MLRREASQVVLLALIATTRWTLETPPGDVAAAAVARVVVSIALVAAMDRRTGKEREEAEVAEAAGATEEEGQEGQELQPWTEEEIKQCLRIRRPKKSQRQR